MGFVLRMVAREARASWRRLVFFFLCVAVGVGAIVALRSVIQSVRAALVAEAKTLTAADLLVSTSRPWSPDVRAAIETRLRDGGATAISEAIETATMARPADESKALARTIELQGVEPAFPFYGRVELEGGQTYSHSLLAGQGALVRPELLAQLDLQVGDTMMIGDLPFTIRGVVLSEPGRRLGFFSFGPRVLIDLADLQRTGLLGFGSRARRMLLVQAPSASVEPLVSGIRKEFQEQFVSARSFRGSEDQIGDDLTRAENYLSLVGFIILILGGIGVWSVTRVFIRQKLKAIAVLKCLGASSRQVLAVYVAQVIALGALGSLVGVALAAIAIAGIPASATAALGGAVPRLTWSAVAQGTATGLLVSLLFSLVPLLEVRLVKPLLLLRDESTRLVATPAAGAGQRWWSRVDWVSVAATFIVVLALVGVAAWQAASLRVGAVVSGAFLGVAIVLHLAGLLLVRLVRPLENASWFPLKHAVMSITRPGSQTRVVLLAVGIGVFFILGVRSLQSNLLEQFRIDLRADGPDLFLVDIQQDQEAGVREFLAHANPAYAARLIPVLRARVTAVQGEDVNLRNYGEVRGQGGLGREFVITYRDHLEENEEVVAGTFWTGPSAEPEVSIEDSVMRRFRIGIGDTVRFDVMGRTIEAKVTSVRKVQWADARTGGFIFVFRPGVFEQAPKTFIAAARAPEPPQERGRMQRDLVAKFPNVSVIDVREIAARVQAVAGNVVLAVSIVGLVAVLSGLLILAGSVTMTKFQRLHESAVFKTLGATTPTLATMLAIEYGALGTLAGTIGAIGSLGLTWTFCRFVLDIPWSFTPEVVVPGLVLTAVVVGALGVIASLDVLRRKPLGILRAE
jgi:putative ABC transport system permease protein